MANRTKAEGAERYRRMYASAIDALEHHLLHERDGFTYLADADGEAPIHHMDHLECFVPGMLALGATTGAVDSVAAARHLQIADRLCETCVRMYLQSPCGLAGELYTFNGRGMEHGQGSYRLRPETVESLMILWRITHEIKYRNWAAAILDALESACKVPTGGYSGIVNVFETPPVKDNFQVRQRRAAPRLMPALRAGELLDGGDAQVPLSHILAGRRAAAERVRAQHRGASTAAVRVRPHASGRVSRENARAHRRAHRHTRCDAAAIVGVEFFASSGGARRSGRSGAPRSPHRHRRCAAGRLGPCAARGLGPPRGHRGRAARPAYIKQAQFVPLSSKS